MRCVLTMPRPSFSLWLQLLLPGMCFCLFGTIGSNPASSVLGSDHGSMEKARPIHLPTVPAASYLGSLPAALGLDGSFKEAFLPSLSISCSLFVFLICAPFPWHFHLVPLI